MLALAVAAGDPQGVGPAVAVAAARRAVALGARVVLVGDAVRLEESGAPSVRHPSDAPVAVLDVPAGNLAAPPPSAAGGAASLAALEAACGLVDAGAADALVTAPLAKEAVARVEPGFSGHTGWLGRRYGVEPVMMLASDVLRVVLVTDHVPLDEVSSRIDEASCVKAITAARDAASRLYGRTRPRIAVLGLNPHAGEGGRFGREELEVIAPAVARCGGAGAGIEGPFPADSFFRADRVRGYDVVVAMYHDQGLIPLKALSMGRAVNVTLGLPIVRTSPDHGTAFDLVPGAEIDTRSMERAVEEALRLTALTRGAGNDDPS